MEIWRIAGAGLITAIATIIVKQTKPDLAGAVTLTGTLVIAAFIADMLKDTIAALNSIAEVANVENGLIKTLLKIIGIGYLTEFAAGTLTDFGVSSVADKVILGGKLAIFAISMPLLSSVFEVLNGFLALI